MQCNSLGYKEEQLKVVAEAIRGREVFLDWIQWDRRLCALHWLPYYDLFHEHGEPSRDLTDGNKGVKKGDYRLVFFTPEMLLERRRWRNMLKGEVYTTRLRTIAVDEAHTVKKWYDLYTCVLFYSLHEMFSIIGVRHFVESCHKLVMSGPCCPVM